MPVTDRLKATPPPPPQVNGRKRMADIRNARRAAQARRILERDLHVSDGHTYGSRPSARDKAKRLIDALVRFEDVPREHLHYTVRLMLPGRPGWRWWVYRSDPTPPDQPRKRKGAPVKS